MTLPKRIEQDERASRVEAALASTEPLWPGGELRVARIALGQGLREVLASAHAARRVVRGLELAEKQLDGEAKGLANVDAKTAQSRGARVSRLVLVTEDAAERMCRRVETLWRRHPDRVLVLRVSAPGDELGELLFGAGRPAKLVMLDHKDAVANALLTLAGTGG